MAEMKSSLKFTIKNMDSVKVNLSQLANRAQRLQHLIKELGEGLIELENDVNHLEVVIEAQQEEGK